jgi:hypothetical protein
MSDSDKAITPLIYFIRNSPVFFSDLFYQNHPCVHSSDLFYQHHPCVHSSDLRSEHRGDSDKTNQRRTQGCF